MRMFLVTILVCFFTNSRVALGDETCPCQAGQREHHQGLNFFKTIAEHKIRLYFNETKLTQDINAAYVCSEPAQSLNHAKLWMPSMGHGSSPVSIVRLADDYGRA